MSTDKITSFIPFAEDPAYLTQQLITCIGNKRALLGHIELALSQVKQRLGKQQLSVFDVFSGSGVVTRLLKGHASSLVCNDLEGYAALLGRCYLTNRSEIDSDEMLSIVEDANNKVDAVPYDAGFIERMYSPPDETDMQPDDRAFYTPANAKRLDNYRRLFDEYPAKYKDLLMGPLLSEASIHVNTAGHFKSFYRDLEGIPRYGGAGRNALKRIKSQIAMSTPILSRFECDYTVFQEEANTLVPHIKDIDVAYVDPPYSQHPYGSNYFMLNLLVSYEKPVAVSRKSGIPVNWKRSGYNSASTSYTLLGDLFRNLNASFLIVSYSNEGFVSPPQIKKLLNKIGKVDEMRIPYTAYRGSRNFRKRPKDVVEYIFIVERS